MLVRCPAEGRFVEQPAPQPVPLNRRLTGGGVAVFHDREIDHPRLPQPHLHLHKAGAAMAGGIEQEFAHYFHSGDAAVGIGVECGFGGWLQIHFDAENPIPGLDDLG